MDKNTVLSPDNQLLRNTCGNNQWPKDLLAKYHPRDDYDGDELTVITCLVEGAFGFFLDAALHTDDAEMTLDSTILQLPGEGLDLVTVQVATEAMKLFTNNTLRHGTGKPMNRVEMLRIKHQLYQLLHYKTLAVMKEKARLEVPRPPSYSGEFDDVFTKEPCYAYPCLGATLIAATGNFIKTHFELSEEDIQVLEDTVYFIAMLPAMAGVNSIEAVIGSIKAEGYFVDTL